MTDKPSEEITELDQALCAVVTKVNSERLYQGARDKVVRHPLLKERFGGIQIPVNVVVHRMLSDIALVDRSFGPETFAHEQARHHSEDLMKCAADPIEMALSLNEFGRCIDKETPGERIEVFRQFQQSIKGIFALPTSAQSMVLYGVVNYDCSLGKKTPSDLLAKALSIRRDVAAQHTVKAQEHAQYLSEVDSEVHFIDEWLTRQGT